MTVVVVGAGHAGVQLAASLRDEGYPDRVVLVEAQTELPYQRPPLSKQFLGPTGEEQPLRGQQFFGSRDIELALGTPVAALRTAERSVELADGRTEGYTHLVLALGSRSRRLAVPGRELDGVVELRTLADARSLRERLGTARDVVVVGGGFIGLEVAAAAAGAASVTVVEPLDRVLRRAVTPLVSETVQQAHARAGVTVRLGVGVAEVTGAEGRVSAVVLSDGRRLPADLVVVGVGVEPSTDLAAAAGLTVDDGVLVDPWLRTSAPGVFAIGDCVSRPVAGATRPRRLECVQNAVDQARHVASSIVHGTDEPYDQVPWFWTHQFHLRIQTVGVGHDDDEEVLVGDPAQQGFSVCRFHGGRLVAVESVNRPQDHVAARRLLSHGPPVTVDVARGTHFDLKEHARASR